MILKTQHSLLYIIIVVTVIGCIDRWEKELRRIEKPNFYTNDYGDWELVQELDEVDRTFYSIHKIDADTVKTVHFYVVPNDTAYVSAFIKRYPCGELDTCLVHMSGLDTLFFYRKTGESRFFFVGEYYYRYAMSGSKGMTQNELSYFLEHEDSLRRVKGNNLPALPSIVEKDGIK